MDLTTLKADLANVATAISDEVAILGGDVSAGLHAIEEVGPAILAGAKMVITVIQAIGCFKSPGARTDLNTASEIVDTLKSGLGGSST
jgi:hypothetical protein